MRVDQVPYDDVAAYLKTRDDVLLPVGANEQYGPHLPTGTETLIVERLATAVGERTGVAVAPALPLNYSAMFLDYPGTLSVEMDVLGQVLGAMVASLAGQGFRHVLFVNIHAGSLGPMEAVARQARTAHGVLTATVDVFKIMRDVGGVTYTATHSPTGHAAELTTSVMLHLAPDQVRMDRARSCPIGQLHPDFSTAGSGSVTFASSGFNLYADMSDYNPAGCNGDPTAATAAQGRQLFDNAVTYVAEVAERFRTVTLPARH